MFSNTSSSYLCMLLGLFANIAFCMVLIWRHYYKCRKQLKLKENKAYSIDVCFCLVFFVFFHAFLFISLLFYFIYFSENMLEM